MDRTVIVTQTVKVDLVEEAFTEQFMSEFRDMMYPFHTVEEHAEHIAQLAARGLLSLDFIEGYGKASSFVKRVEIVDIEQTVEPGGRA